MMSILNQQEKNITKKILKNNMNFKFGEIIETEKFQFVRIHKNGNKSVVKCIENSFKEEEISYVFRLSSKPRFCIIRDPYERFISGLKYDLSRSTIDIKDIDIKQLFTANEVHPRNIWKGYIKHSISQMPYLFNTQCSHYIDLKDLNTFLKIHFNQIAHENKSTINNNIEKYIDKDEVIKYLHLDYYMYNTIKKSPFLWEWQHGKIFE